jgi:hypothetical protein
MIFLYTVDHLWRKKKKRSKVSSLLTSLSPLKKKKHQENSVGVGSGWLISSKVQNTQTTPAATATAASTANNLENANLPSALNEEGGAVQEGDDQDDEDEFFLAISSTGLRTGSCPEFFFYPHAPPALVANSSSVEFNQEQVVPVSRFVRVLFYAKFQLTHNKLLVK